MDVHPRTIDDNDVEYSLSLLVIVIFVAVAPMHYSKCILNLLKYFYMFWYRNE